MADCMVCGLPPDGELEIPHLPPDGVIVWHHRRCACPHGAESELAELMFEDIWNRVVTAIEED